MRKYQNQKWSVSKNQRGATAVIVGASIFALVGIAALVVDLGNLYVARNELQNAADAGALAGASVLYNDTGTAINSSANEVAYNVAKTNFSQNKSVDVNWTSGNDGDVQRGHWSFGRSEDLDKGFYPNDSCGLTDLWNVSFDELDADPDFINAVRVVARRQATPVASFFAKIFGWKNFEVSAEAVGYIGFADEINPGDLDLPMAICIDSVLVDNKYSCNIGRVINNGNDDTTSETGRWTNFASVPDENPDSCDHQADSVDNNDFKDMPMCDGGLNTNFIYGGDELGTNNGAMGVLSIIYDCFVEKYNNDDTPWKVTIPVIDCNSPNSTCAIVVGAVTVTIVWVTNAKDYAEAPIAMGGMRDSEGYYVVGDDAKPLYEDWGAPLDENIKVNSNIGEEESLYEFMKTLDDYSGVEDWDKDLTKEFSDPNDPPSYEWYELPLDTFFETEGMSLGETKAAGMVRWASFIRHFNLKNVIVTDDGELAKPAPFAKESIYFLPDCTPHDLAGRTGGENFGVLAKIPALVH